MTDAQVHWKEFQESCWALVGSEDEPGTWKLKRRKKTTGCAANVETQWAWALAREEQSGDVYGFFHTHPAKARVELSETDRHTMQAWSLAFGKAMVCVIQTSNQISATLFEDSESAGKGLRVVSMEKGGVYHLEK
jgi:hypothetical protein